MTARSSATGPRAQGDFVSKPSKDRFQSPQEQDTDVIFSLSPYQTRSSFRGRNADVTALGSQRRRRVVPELRRLSTNGRWVWLPTPLTRFVRHCHGIIFGHGLWSPLPPLGPRVQMLILPRCSFRVEMRSSFLSPAHDSILPIPKHRQRSGNQQETRCLGFVDLALAMLCRRL